MLVKEVGEFLSEASATVTFYERCLFYSSTSPTLSSIPKDTYTFSRFLAGVETVRLVELELQAERIPRSLIKSFVDNQTRERFHIDCSAFMAMYSDAHRLLLNRLDRVSMEYTESRDLIRQHGITIADRDNKYTEASKNEIRQRCKELLENITRNLEKTSPDDLVTVCRFYTNEWKVLRTSGFVLMDEISFLSKRVDDFHNLLSSKQSAEDTAHSVRFAYVALCVSAFLSFCGLLFTLKQHYVDQIIYPVPFVERGKIQRRIADLQHFVEDNGGNIEHNRDDANSDIPAVRSLDSGQH